MRLTRIAVLLAGAAAMTTAAHANPAFVGEMFRLDIELVDGGGTVVGNETWSYWRGQEGVGTEAVGTDTYIWDLGADPVLFDVSGIPGVTGDFSLDTARVELAVGSSFSVFSSWDITNTTGLDANISVTSNLLSTAGLINAAGRGDSSVTVTSSSFSAASTLTPVASQGWQAFVNSTGGAGTGTDVITHHTSDVSSPNLFTPASENIMSPGPSSTDFMALGLDVDDISSLFSFTMSGAGVAAGSSLFEVIPTPASASLFALGGLVAVRRRR